MFKFSYTVASAEEVKNKITELRALLDASSECPPHLRSLPPKEPEFVDAVESTDAPAPTETTESSSSSEPKEANPKEEVQPEPSPEEAAANEELRRHLASTKSNVEQSFHQIISFYRWKALGERMYQIQETSPYLDSNNLRNEIYNMSYGADHDLVQQRIADNERELITGA